MTLDRSAFDARQPVADLNNGERPLHKNELLGRIRGGKARPARARFRKHQELFRKGVRFFNDKPLSGRGTRRA